MLGSTNAVLLEQMLQDTGGVGLQCKQERRIFNRYYGSKRICSDLLRAMLVK